MLVLKVVGGVTKQVRFVVSEQLEQHVVRPAHVWRTNEAINTAKSNDACVRSTHRLHKQTNNHSRTCAKHLRTFGTQTASKAARRNRIKKQLAV